MKQVKNILIKLGVDAIFGLIAAVFAYFLLGEIIPQMFETYLSAGGGALKISINFDELLMKKIFSIPHNFCLLFGIRLVVAYISGSYAVISKNKLIEETK